MDKIKKITKYSIFLLFLMLPVIDCIRRTPIKNVDIFGFSIIEIFNIIIIGYTFVLTLISLKNRKKELMLLLIYTGVLIIYLLLHGINIINFDSTIYIRSNINIITETYYILRVYYMPVLLLFILIKNKDIFDIKFYCKLAQALICMISLSIILLNVFKLSYATYAATNDEFVKYNIFDFYKSSESPKLLSTRGWFDSSNEIAVILLMLLPINIYMLCKENKKRNVFLYIIQFLAMIILGTRLSAIGTILATIVAILVNVFSKIIKQNRINYKLIICGVLCTGYFFISPVGVYLLNYESPNYNMEDEHNEILQGLTSEEEITKYITDHLYEFRIDSSFVNMYPIDKDVVFWKEVALRDRNLNNDSRVMKISIIRRIQERNDNYQDKLLGMGYTMNFMDLERDYVYQYYIFGLLGIILIIPQILFFIKSGLTILKNIKKCSLITMILIIMSPSLGFVSAYYGGHLFGWISPSYILIFSIAMLNYFVTNKANYKGCEQIGKSKCNSSSI